MDGLKTLALVLVLMHIACTAQADILGQPDKRSACIEWAKYAAVGANSQDTGRPLVLKQISLAQLNEHRAAGAVPMDGIYFYRPDGVTDAEAAAEWEAVQEGYRWGEAKNKEIGLHAWKVPDEMLWQMLFPICMDKERT
jgi:hypothetical protein